MNINKLLLTAATVTVLGTPAFAQTYINQSQGTDQSLGSTNSATIAYGVGVTTGPIVGTNLNQTAGTQFNVVGPTTYLAVAGNAAINQGAGSFNYTGPASSAGGTLNLTTGNTNSATGTSTLFGSLSVLGSQSGANTVNVANVQGLTAGSTVDVNQAANTAGLPLSPATVSSTNVMSGTAASGAVTVGFGSQTASGSVNTGAFLGTTAAGLSNTVNLEQKYGSLAVTNTNSAIGNVTNGVQASIDPAVTNLGQTSSTQLNAFSLGAGATNLNGGQSQSATTASTVSFGNTAAAYTGTTSPTYNVTGAASVGAASISSTTQSASVAANSVSGAADLTLAGTGGVGAFGQTFNGNETVISSASANPYKGVVNAMVANTDTGAATISGTLSTVGGVTTTSSGQSFNISGNTLSGSTLTGNLSQNATAGAVPTNPNFTAGYVNLALANTTAGTSSINNLAQSGSQSYNTVSATTASNVTLDQTATGSLTGGNLQVASSGANASILGANQSSTLSANVVNVGALGGTNSLTQTSQSGSMVNTNKLATGSAGLTGTGMNNSTITGTQSAVNTVNSIGR